MDSGAPVRVSDTVWTYANSAGSTYVASTGGGIAVFDPGLRGDARLLYRVLRTLRLDPDDVALVGLTHYHADHAGAAAQVAAAVGASIAIGSADAAVVAGEVAEPAPELPAPEREMLAQLAASGTATLAPSRFTPHIRLGRRRELLDGAVLAVHTPGHTAGSTSFLLDGGATALVGDLAVRAPDGRVVVPGFFSADRSAALASLSSVLDRSEPVAVGLGHGSAVSRDELAAALPGRDDPVGPRQHQRSSRPG